MVNKANHASAMNDKNMLKINEEGNPDPEEESLVYVEGMLGLGMAKLDDRMPTSFIPWLARTQNSKCH